MPRFVGRVDELPRAGGPVRVRRSAERSAKRARATRGGAPWGNRGGGPRGRTRGASRIEVLRGEGAYGRERENIRNGEKRREQERRGRVVRVVVSLFDYKESQADPRLHAYT